MNFKEFSEERIKFFDGLAQKRHKINKFCSFWNHLAFELKTFIYLQNIH